jgi:hypothetical protein
MLPFNFIELFFFFSLGITFILILLIVYHFKQRITTIEHKSDTMFDIIQNLAKEIASIKPGQPSQPGHSQFRKNPDYDEILSSKDKSEFLTSEDCLPKHGVISSDMQHIYDNDDGRLEIWKNIKICGLNSSNFEFGGLCPSSTWSHYENTREPMISEDCSLGDKIQIIEDFDENIQNLTENFNIKEFDSADAATDSEEEEDDDDDEEEDDEDEDDDDDDDDEAVDGEENKKLLQISNYDDFLRKSGAPESNELLVEDPISEDILAMDQECEGTKFQSQYENLDIEHLDNFQKIKVDDMDPEETSLVSKDIISPDSSASVDIVQTSEKTPDSYEQYKKLSMSELKKLIISKGIAPKDINKLKRQDLLKLLLL